MSHCTFYLCSLLAMICCCFSIFRFKSTISWEFSPLRLWRAVNSSCWASSFFSKAAMANWAAVLSFPPPPPVEMAVRNCSFSTDIFRLSALSWATLSSKRLSGGRKETLSNNTPCQQQKRRHQHRRHPSPASTNKQNKNNERMHIHTHTPTARFINTNYRRP